MSEQPSTAADPRVTVPQQPRTQIVSVSKLQIEGLEMPLYRVEGANSAKTVTTTARVLKLVREALDMKPREKSAKTSAPKDKTAGKK